MHYLSWPYSLDKIPELHLICLVGVLRKRTVSVEFWANCRYHKLCVTTNCALPQTAVTTNCALPQNCHSKKFDKIAVFYTVNYTVILSLWKFLCQKIETCKKKNKQTKKKAKGKTLKFFTEWLKSISENFMSRLFQPLENIFFTYYKHLRIFSIQFKIFKLLFDSISSSLCLQIKCIKDFIQLLSTFHCSLEQDLFHIFEARFYLTDRQ